MGYPMESLSTVGVQRDLCITKPVVEKINIIVFKANKKQS